MTQELLEEEIKIIDRDRYDAIIESLDEVLIENSANSLLELSILKSKFSLSELISLLESEGFQVLFFWKNDDGDRFSISLVIDSQDLKSVIHTLEDRGYLILSSYNEEGYEDILKERYELLMNYINT